MEQANREIKIQINFKESTKTNTETAVKYLAEVFKKKISKTNREERKRGAF